jgi:hypothetical protein
MALVAPQQAIDAPQRVPAENGLFRVVTPLTDTSLNWVNGVTWLDQDCGLLPAAIVPDCASPVGLPKNLTVTLANGASDVFTLYGEFSCSPVGYFPDKAQEMASARLLTREEQAVTSRIVALLQGAGPLAGDDYTPPTTVAQAIAALERHLAINYAAQGVLIVSLTALTAGGTDSFRATGSGLFTLSGTPVVVDRLDAGNTLSIIPAPLVYRGDVFTSSNRPGDLFDTRNNDLYAVAERNYVVGWVACGGAYSTLA